MRLPEWAEDVIGVSAIAICTYLALVLTAAWP